MISIDNFKVEVENAPVINSPRSDEACHSLGISPDELVKKRMSYFKRKGGSEKLLKRRAERYEERRHENIAMVKETRLEMIKKAKKDSDRILNSPKLVRTSSIKSMKSGNDNSSQLEREKKQLERKQKASFPNPF